MLNGMFLRPNNILVLNVHLQVIKEFMQTWIALVRCWWKMCCGRL